jgi:hypothetical protein
VDVSEREEDTNLGGGELMSRDSETPPVRGDPQAYGHFSRILNEDEGSRIAKGTLFIAQEPISYQKS